MKVTGPIKMCLTEIYSKSHIGKLMSDAFPVHNAMKQGDALSPLLFNFALEYAIRMVQGSKKGTGIEWTHQLLVCADDGNLLGENINIIKKNLEAVLDASKEVGLEVTRLERCNLYWNTHMFFENSELLIKDYINDHT
jgi:hypothetical protein